MLKRVAEDGVDAGEHGRPLAQVLAQGAHVDALALVLLVALVACVALGLGAGSLVGAWTVGAVVGAVVGIPLSFFLVYRQYRDI